MIHLLLKEGAKALYLLNLLNSFHQNIKFTYEPEKNKKIAFLDVLVSRKSNGFFTTLYRKPTFTGVFLNWNSLTARVYKINVIKCLLDRAWKICSNYKLFHLEVLSLKEILMKNSYPCSVIDRTIKEFLDRKHKPFIEEVQEEKDKVYLVLPYFNSEVENFSKRLTSLVLKYYPKVNFKVVFTCPFTIGKMFPFKEKTPKELRSLIVYKIKCSNCPKFYIGKTSRCLIRRLHEHKNGTGKDDYQSALYKHSVETGHVINYTDVEILDSASDDRKLLLKEMLYINKLEPTLNKQLKSSLFSLIIGKN